MKWIASAAFGLEGMTGRDLKRLGAENVRVMDVGGEMCIRDRPISMNQLGSEFDQFRNSG